MSSGADARRPVRALPDALERLDEIRKRLAGRPVAVFLDFDGTLAPIAGTPEAATFPPEGREAVRALARRFPVAVLSGRDLEDVTGKVGLEEVYYGGSHGFDLRGPGGFREQKADDRLPELDAAEEALREAAGQVAGARVERKRHGVALHCREAPDRRVPELEARAGREAARHDGLELHRGREVLELRPGGWDKGRALLRLLERMTPDPEEARPVHVGDDVTDEDAFRAVRERGGVPVIVRGGADDRRTRAAYSLQGPAAVRRFVRALAGEATAAASEDSA